MVAVCELCSLLKNSMVAVVNGKHVPEYVHKVKGMVQTT